MDLINFNIPGLTFWFEDESAPGQAPLRRVAAMALHNELPSLPPPLGSLQSFSPFPVGTDASCQSCCPTSFQEHRGGQVAQVSQSEALPCVDWFINGLGPQHAG